MTFQPIIPVGGYGGWKFLQRTLDQQKSTLLKSPDIARNIDYFKSNIRNVQDASAIVDDRRLMEVTLGAYGLGEDINSKFFIRKVIESNMSDRMSLANKLGDKRYQALASAANRYEVLAAAAAAAAVVDPKAVADKDLDPKATADKDLDPKVVANKALDSFIDDMVSRYSDKMLQAAVGNINGDLRLALNIKQSLIDATKGTDNTKAQWYKVLGTPPLRAVFEAALNLPKSIGTLDIDYQVKQFKMRAKSVFGTDTLSDFKGEDLQEKLTATFLTRSELKQFSANNSSAQNALMMLSQIQFPKVSLY